jgi:signal transduction histidine kinase
MIALEDISEKVNNLELIELDKYKDNILATVTHDIKTPLNGMIAILELT